MGELPGKPKVEGARRPFQSQQRRGQVPSVAAPKATAFSAPTSGYKKMVFTFDQVDSASRFEECRQTLSRYVSATYKYGGSMTQKAIQDLMEPTFIKPAPLPAGADKWDEIEWGHKASQVFIRARRHGKK